MSKQNPIVEKIITVVMGLLGMLAFFVSEAFKWLKKVLR
jgi:hypothetical protein